MRTTLQAFHHRPQIERVGSNMRPFEVVSPFQPAGDQGEAIIVFAPSLEPHVICASIALIDETMRLTTAFIAGYVIDTSISFREGSSSSLRVITR